MGSVIVLMILLGIWVGVIFGCVAVAEGKGRSPLTWGILGFLFGLIALIVVAILPPVSPEGVRRW